MSGVKIGGTWRTPATAHVKVAGAWRTAATISVKVAGTWRTTTLAGPPPVPTLSYTAENTFTITNYNANLVYTVSGATRSGNTLTGVSNGATIRAAYAAGAPQSAVRTMNLLAHGRVLTSVYSGPHSNTGCGPRPGTYCGGGSISDVNGGTWSGPGTKGPAEWCGGSCPDDCYGYFNFYCYNWYWTDYSGSGYSLQGNVWGKAS